MRDILNRCFVFLCSMLIFASCTAATVYKSVDANGNVVFTDKPTPNAEKLQVESVQSYDSQDEPHQVVHKKNLQPSNNSSTKLTYDRFAILSPADQDVIHSNEGSITVQVKIAPELQKGDKLRVLIDGKPAGETSSGTSVSLTGIERGAHTLTAEIVDAKDTVVKSSTPITVYVQQIGLNSPAHKNNPQVFHTGP